MRMRLGGGWIADSVDVLLLHKPGHYPVAFFPLAALRSGVLVAEDRTTQHRELGDTAWFTSPPATGPPRAPPVWPSLTSKPPTVNSPVAASR
jgi:nucleotidyltransferase-like protein